MGHNITATHGCHWVVCDMEGRVLSQHRSEDAAERAVEAELRAFRRSPHSRGGAYLPRNIIHVGPSGGAYIERTGQYSTGWHIPA